MTSKAEVLFRPLRGHDSTTDVGSLGPAPGFEAVVAQRPSPENERAVAAFRARYSTTLAALRKAHDDPHLWKGSMAQEPARELYRELLATVRYHARAAAAQGAGSVHEAILSEALKLSGMTSLEAQELVLAPPSLVAAGDWEPMTIRAGRMTETANQTPSDDRYLRLLNLLSRYLLPPLLKLDMLPPGEGLQQVMERAKKGELGAAGLLAVRELALAPLKLLYEGGDLVTRWLDEAGQPTAAFLDAVAHELDRRGDAHRTVVQQSFHDMSQALQQLGTSRRAVAGMAEADRDMMLLAASSLRETTADVEQWMDFLRQPKERRDPRLLDDEVFARRTPFDAAAWLLHHVASGVEKLSDKEAWDQFSIRFGVGVGGGIGAQGLRATLAFIFPSLAEYRGGHASVKVESGANLILWFKRDGISSRGGKTSVTFWALGVRDADFSQALNFKNEMLLPVGFAFRTDTTLPAAIEGSLNTGLPLPPGSPIHATCGVDLAVQHPHLRVLAPVVAPVASTLGTATEVAVNVLSATWQTGKRLVAGKKATDPEVLVHNRLGRSAVLVRSAGIALAQLQHYKELIAEGARRGAPLGDKNSVAYREATKSLGEARAVDIISTFLAEKERQLIATLEEVRTATEAPERHPYLEVVEQAKVHQLCKQLKAPTQAFELANALLASLFGSVPEAQLPEVPGPQEQGKAA